MLRYLVFSIGACLLAGGIAFAQSADTKSSTSTHRVSSSDASTPSDVEEYETKGKFIYGVMRFDFYLTLLTRHLDEENSEVSEDADLKLAKRIEVASGYFAAHPEHVSQQSDVMSVFQTAYRLEQVFSSIGQEENIDEHVMALRDVHLQLAEIFERLGVPDINPRTLNDIAKRFELLCTRSR